MNKEEIKSKTIQNHGKDSTIKQDYTKTTSEKKSNRIATYGSLRSGQYNNVGYKSLDSKGEFEIEGWELYSLGSYPGAKNTKDPEHKMIVEVFELDERDLRDINAMERGAGYNIRRINVGGFEDVIIYEFMYEDYFKKEKQVLNGDWVNPVYL